MMAVDAVRRDPQYWAFISYSHKDAAFGRRLHRRLESYSLPGRLVGRATSHGVVPRRLVPIFRDREELPAAASLTAEVRAALRASRSLVVVCSPAAAASPWVAREVELFREIHPEAPILAAILDGEPASVFPGGLRTSGPDGMPIEPLAADFRAHRDGMGLGLLKLVAGIAGLRLDELVERDAQARNRRVTAITVASLVAVVAMGVLTTFAWNARSDALHQRSAAEGLVEFMLTDLRERLRGVGRLDIMGAVNAHALQYYADQPLESLPVTSLERRAHILHAMGEDDETRGNHQAALDKFHQAQRTTAALLAQAPNDPERIFDHAQSVYWIGYVHYQQEHYREARQAFLSYKHYADQMVSLAPASEKYRKELSYAESNLCSVDLKGPVDPKDTMRHCVAALSATKEAAQLAKRQRGAKAEGDFDDDVMNCLGKIATAYKLSGDLNRARATRLEEESILDRKMAADPKNMDLKDTWIAVQIALARLDQAAGDADAAMTRLLRALKVVNSMIAYEPANARWVSHRDFIQRQLKLMGDKP